VRAGRGGLRAPRKAHDAHVDARSGWGVAAGMCIIRPKCSPYVDMDRLWGMPVGASVDRVSTPFDRVSTLNLGAPKGAHAWPPLARGNLPLFALVTFLYNASLFLPIFRGVCL
jgi:hypothetical protein